MISYFNEQNQETAQIMVYKEDMMHSKPRLAFFCSGAGTTFEYLAKQPQFQPALLVTDRKAPVLEKAKTLSIPSIMIRPKDYSSYTMWDQAVRAALTGKNIDLIILAGFLFRMGSQVLSQFPNKILNSHPALLPQFGGKGMYGLHVHQAVLKAKKSVTGISIHYVNEKYDQGALVAQKKINILPTDTPQTLEQRIKQAEKSFYAQTISQVWQKHP